MAAIVTNKFRLNNAEQFYESFSEASTSFYLFVGRPQPWTSTSPFGGGTDSAPPTPLDNVDDEYMYFRDMLAAKRIAAADIQYAIPRHNWTTGTIYDYYRGDYGAQWSSTASDIVKTENDGTNLWASTTLFYVLSSTNNVYKCMSNNGGVASTVEPSGTSNSEYSTGDGYVWKYMYSLTTTQITDFLTADFMPVTTNGTVSGAAIDGAVTQYKVMRGGAGYTSNTYSGQTLRGDGSGATFDLVVSGGVVTAVTSVAAGTGYTFGDLNIDSIAGIGTSIAYKMHYWVERTFKIDDAVGAVAVHGYAGVVGLVICGFVLWGYPSSGYDGYAAINPMGMIIGAVIMFGLLGFLPGWILAKILHGMGKLRIPRDVELAGLDYNIMEAASKDEKAVASSNR